MSIRVQCAGCHKWYQVKDELGGRRAKCKACGAVLSIPRAAVAAVAHASDEDETPVNAGQGWSAPAASSAPSASQSSARALHAAADDGVSPRQALLDAPPAQRKRKSSAGTAIGIFCVLLLLAGGGVAALFHIRGVPIVLLPDSTVQSRIIGNWTLTKSAIPDTTASLVFKADGTYSAHIINKGNVVDLDGPFSVKQHHVNLTHAPLSNLKNPFVLGPVRELTETTMVLASVSGDETYARTTNAK